MFPTTLIAAAVIPLIMDPDSHGNIPFDANPVAALFSVCTSLPLRMWTDSLDLDISGTSQGLAPTLIIVRVAHRQSVDSVQQMMSIHFAEKSSQHAIEPTGANVVGSLVDIHASRLQREDLEARLDTERPEGRADEARAV